MPGKDRRLKSEILVSNVEIIPVIDLMRGVVVRGIAGRRESYQPIQSRLVTNAEPAAIAHAFVEQLQLRTVYLADLDAIAGQEPSWVLYEQIAAAGLKLWIDAGLGDPDRAAALVKYAAQHAFVTGLIVGLESVQRAELLADFVRQIGVERAIFSLDLLHGVPLIRPSVWPENMSPKQIAAVVHQAGFGRMIVLDLASVGVHQGPSTIELGRELQQAYPQLTLIGGGGVRCNADLDALAQAGYQGVLVASALHDGRMTRQEVERFSIQ